MRKNYLLCYVYEDINGLMSVGSCTFDIPEGKPLTAELLNDVVGELKQNMQFPEDRKLIPLAFSKFEGWGEA